MIKLLDKFESTVNIALMLMLFVVIALAVTDIAFILIEDILTPPLFRVSAGDLLKLFGMFLLVLVGLELLETVKRFYFEGEIKLQVIFTVALLALGRKIIILEPEKYDGLSLIGIGVIVLALVIGYVLVNNNGLLIRGRQEKPDTGET